VTFLILEFFTNSKLISTSWIRDFNIQNIRIHDFNIMNSPIQCHEFTISATRLHDFNFTTSPLELHEFTFWNSRIQLRKFTILTLWTSLSIWPINYFVFKRDKSTTLHIFGIVFFLNVAVKFNRWIHEVEFMHLKSWIHKFEPWIRQVEIINSLSWKREFVNSVRWKRKSGIHEFEMSPPVFRRYMHVW
jgi:hypothetical protein